VMNVVNACRLRLLETCGRVSISLRIDDRKGRPGRLVRKVASAREKAGL